MSTSPLVSLFSTSLRVVLGNSLYFNGNNMYRYFENLCMKSLIFALKSSLRKTLAKLKKISEVCCGLVDLGSDFAMFD